MKNVKLFYHRDDIHQHFYHLWKTPLFKKDHDRAGSFIHSIMERVAHYPVFIYDLSEHPDIGLPPRYRTEWKHFSPWWGGIINYRIGNPAIHDTCWLHDLYHKGYMPYMPDLSPEIFREKMLQHEVRTSVKTVFEMYFHYPDLRQETREEELLVDRYLRDNSFLQRWQDSPDEIHEELVIALRGMSLCPCPQDPAVNAIYHYHRKNELWLTIWRQRYNLVETRMHDLHRKIQLGGDRKEHMEKFMAWLLSNDISCGGDIPFPAEAYAFAEAYQQND